LNHFALSNKKSWQTLELTSNWDPNTKWFQISFQHFQTTWKFWTHIKNTFLHLFKVSALLMMTTRRYHFQNKLIFKLKLKFQILISLSIHIQMVWVFWSFSLFHIKDFVDETFYNMLLKIHILSSIHHTICINFWWITKNFLKVYRFYQILCFILKI
jgi:hypothetical protein